MIAHGKEIKVFCGNSNPTFAQGVCDELGLTLGRSEVKSSLTAKSPYPSMRQSADVTCLWCSPPATRLTTI